MGLELLLNGETRGDRPLICIEVNPPRGVDASQIFERLDGCCDGVDLFNVTDSALARMKCAAFPFASMLKARYGIEPLVNLSCRDRNLIAIQGDLLAAWMLGVRSVIALTGDAVTIGDFPDCKGVFEVNSLGLLSTVNKLNSGTDLVGNLLKGTPNFISGVVVNPNARNPKAEIRRLQKKKDAGAQYALSQPVFDEESAVSFFTEASQVGIPLLVGLLPFRSSSAALGIAQIPGIRLSASLEALVRDGEEKDLSDFSIEHCLQMAESCRHVVRGFHVISGATPRLGMRLVGELVKRWQA